MKRFPPMCTIKHFYPRSPCGERRQSSAKSTPEEVFLSTLSLRRATIEFKLNFVNQKFLSTLSLRRATPAGTVLLLILCPISIHALLAESDVIRKPTTGRNNHFYPRSPCGERRRSKRLKSRLCVFLSTLSLRRATINSVLPGLAKRYFYPRSPCGERLGGMSDKLIGSVFLSTLSLRRATITKQHCNNLPIFLSTLSLRRATAKVHKTVGHFCAYETNFMGIASSC